MGDTLSYHGFFHRDTDISFEDQNWIFLSLPGLRNEYCRNPRKFAAKYKILHSERKYNFETESHKHEPRNSLLLFML